MAGSSLNVGSCLVLVPIWTAGIIAWFIVLFVFSLFAFGLVLFVKGTYCFVADPAFT